MIEEENLTYAEALWDHVTMDPEELGFRAGELIRVTDTANKHWWYGHTEHREGWFPATFVRVSPASCVLVVDWLLLLVVVVVVVVMVLLVCVCVCVCVCVFILFFNFCF
jgi:hypothetical protein